MAQNPIVEENDKIGNSYVDWGINGIGDPENQGFATDISVNHGETVHFKIKTNATQYHLEIYRMGYYLNGEGARRIDTVPVGPLPEPVPQPDPQIDPATGLVDCSSWSESASWSMPGDAISGIYFAKLVRETIGGVPQVTDPGASHIFFVVRDDERNSELLFQTSDATWQAYNGYGGHSLYTAPGVDTVVGYNRPFFNRRDNDPSGTPRSWVFFTEYPMVRWLEANGYDVSYFTCVDSNRRGAAISNHKVFLSVGHDEYWSDVQRQHVTDARDAGVHLIFASGNEVFWKTTWDGNQRTLTCRKICPNDLWRFTEPENALTGALFGTVTGEWPYQAIRVPGEYSRFRFWANTDIAQLDPDQDQALELGQGALGYEGNEYSDRGNPPDGLLRLSYIEIPLGGGVWSDQICGFGPGTFRHALTLYRHQSGALVFGAHSATWSWGLDGHHDILYRDNAGNLYAYYVPGDPRFVPPDPADRFYLSPDANLRQAIVNLLADMGVQPGTLQTQPEPQLPGHPDLRGLVAATASTDTTPPTSMITSPADGASVPHGTPLTVTGNATDNGGGVVVYVEVSIDNGLTWHPALGRESFSYALVTPDSPGLLTITSRAVDDSGNLQGPTPRITLTVT
jgi:Bacterial Ig domain